MLRRRRSSTRVEVEDELETVADKAAITWSFLLAFGAESPSFNRQESECVSVWMSSERWERVVLQVKVQNLSEDLPAAQYEALMKFFPSDAMKKMRKNVVPEELRKIEVDSKVRRCSQADKFRRGMIEDSANDVREVPLFRGRGHGATQDSIQFEFRESIAAVWLIDNTVKFENAATSLFGQLRPGCLHFMCVTEALDSEAESAPVLFDFLIDFAKTNRMRLKELSF